jgi:hypothetical protein
MMAWMQCAVPLRLMSMICVSSSRLAFAVRWGVLMKICWALIMLPTKSEFSVVERIFWNRNGLCTLVRNGLGGETYTSSVDTVINAAKFEDGAINHFFYRFRVEDIDVYRYCTIVFIRGETLAFFCCSCRVLRISVGEDDTRRSCLGEEMCCFFSNSA